LIETAPSLHVPLGTVALFLLVLVHGGWRYGVRTILVFLGISLVISNILENAGVLTGFPFGPYFYTEALGLKIFQVPLLVSLAWFTMGYLSWTLAGMLLGPVDKHPRAGGLFWMPLVASFLMVAWDLTFDPLSSTVYRSWVWPGGGPYFGVPVSNFLGWFLTVFLVMLAFAFYLGGAAADTRRKSRPLPKWYWLSAAIVYGMMGLFPLTSWLALPPVMVMDGSGRSWLTTEICATLSLVSLFTMMFSAVLGIARVAMDKTPQPRLPGPVR
jgi:putative membrane protein